MQDAASKSRSLPPLPEPVANASRARFSPPQMRAYGSLCLALGAQPLRADANIIACVIESIDHRAMAADTVTPTLEEATVDELRTIYEACKRIQAEAPAQSAPQTHPPESTQPKETMP